IGRHYQSQFIAYGHQRRRNVDFYSHINRCQKTISILTTNLGFVVNEYLEYAPGKEATFLQMIAESISNKPLTFQIKILALDPDSNFTNDRASALGRGRTEFRETMKQDLNTICDFLRSSDCTRRAQVRIYDEFPYQMTYFFDDFVVSSVVAKTIS